MWEEHPSYQKVQVTAVGLLVLGLFIGAIVHYRSIHDWDGIRLVLYAGAGLVAALVIFPLAAWVIVKVGKRRFSRAKCRNE